MFVSREYTPEKIYTSIVSSISNTDFRDTPRLDSKYTAVCNKAGLDPVYQLTSQSVKHFLKYEEIWFMASVVVSSWSL